MVRENLNHTIFLLILVLLVIQDISILGDPGINPLRFEEGQRKWQVTLNIARATTDHRRLSLERTGLWEERRYLEDTAVSMSGTFDVNEAVSLQGGFTWLVNEYDFSETNLWTGVNNQVDGVEEELAGGKLMIKYGFWRNSELKAYFLLPIFGREATVGLTWSQDPIMVFPRVILSGERIGLDGTISFVTNPDFAITGSGSFSYSDGYSALGFGGGLVYRNGKHDGVKVSASLEKGRATKLSLGVGLTYGEEK